MKAIEAELSQIKKKCVVLWWLKTCLMTQSYLLFFQPSGDRSRFMLLYLSQSGCIDANFVLEKKAGEP